MRCCNVYNTKSIKLLKTSELHRLSRAKRNAKCCKDFVKTDLLLANHCFIRACKTTLLSGNDIKNEIIKKM